MYPDWSLKDILMQFLNFPFMLINIFMFCNIQKSDVMFSGRFAVYMLCAYVCYGPSDIIDIQYTPHFVPAPVDRACASAWPYKQPLTTCHDNKLSTSMTHIACDSKPHSVVRSFMHPSPGTWMAIGCAVVFLPGLPPHLVQELNVGTVQAVF